MNIYLIAFMYKIGWNMNNYIFFYKKVKFSMELRFRYNALLPTRSDVEVQTIYVI